MEGTERRFSPGFRLSRLDVVVLVLGAVATVRMARVEMWIAIALGFVVGHFFLFCNVLRMSRVPELIWAGVFAGLAIQAEVFQVVGWPVVFEVSGGLTVVLAGIEMRRARYHGVGWRRVNPGLPEWWEKCVALQRR